MNIYYRVIARNQFMGLSLSKSPLFPWIGNTVRNMKIARDNGRKKKKKNKVKFVSLHGSLLPRVQRSGRHSGWSANWHNAFRQFAHNNYRRLHNGSLSMFFFPSHSVFSLVLHAVVIFPIIIFFPPLLACLVHCSTVFFHQLRAASAVFPTRVPTRGNIIFARKPLFKNLNNKMIITIQ